MSEQRVMAVITAGCGIMIAVGIIGFTMAVFNALELGR